MLRTRKSVVLAIVTLLAAGCAQSGHGLRGPQYPDFRSGRKPKTLRGKPQPPPKILPQTHFAAGTLFESQGRVDKAIDQYRKAIAVNHNYVAAYHRLGRLLSVTGRHGEAVEALSRAVELKPDSAVLRNNLGYELMFQRRWADAEGELLRAIQLDPEMAQAHINLGLVLSQAGRFDEALASFLAVLPEADAYYNLGLMFRGQGREDQAAEAFRRVLSINADFPAAKTQLDQLKETRKQVEAAAPHAQKTVPPAKPKPATDTTQSMNTRPTTPSHRRPDDTMTLDEILAKVDGMMASAKIPTADDLTIGAAPVVEPKPGDGTDTGMRKGFAHPRTPKPTPRVTQGSERIDTTKTIHSPKTIAFAETVDRSKPVEPAEPTTIEPVKRDVPAQAATHTTKAGRAKPDRQLRKEVADAKMERDRAAADLTMLRETLDSERRRFERMTVATTDEVAATDRIAEPEERPYSLDTAAMLSELENRLSIVRNEIECLRENGAKDTTDGIRPIKSSTTATDGLIEPTIVNTRRPHKITRTNTTRRTEAATIDMTRPAEASTVIALMGPPADLAPTLEELAAQNLARIQRKPTPCATATTDWRTPFAELETLLSITHNELLCWQDHDTEAEETVVIVRSTELKDTKLNRKTEEDALTPAASRTFGAPAPTPPKPHRK